MVVVVVITTTREAALAEEATEDWESKVEGVTEYEDQLNNLLDIPQPLAVINNWNGTKNVYNTIILILRVCMQVHSLPKRTARF